MIIYKIANKFNGKIYIGQTKNSLRVRVGAHLNADSLIGRALRKYGMDLFTITAVALAISRQELDEKEQYWIKELNSEHPNGYNLTLGGGGGNSKARTEEWKREKSKKMTGDNNPAKRLEVRNRISIAAKGKVFSEEHIQRLSESHMGHIHSKDCKQKIGIASVGERNGMYGKHHSVETRQKIKNTKAANPQIPPMLGRHHSEETKEKIRAALMGRAA